nr:hypothetical protein [Tanacetum cinerariifolium]
RHGGGCGWKVVAVAGAGSGGRLVDVVHVGSGQWGSVGGGGWWMVLQRRWWLVLMGSAVVMVECGRSDGDDVVVGGCGSGVRLPWWCRL